MQILLLTPDTNYGKSKLLSENIIFHSCCKSTILRLGGVYGKGGPDHLGINKAITLANKGIAPKITGLGLGRRNYIYVKDVASLIIQVFEENITGVKYIGGEIKTIKSMLTDISEILLDDKKINFVEGSDTNDLVIENSNFYSITPFRESIKRMS